MKRRNDALTPDRRDAVRMMAAVHFQTGLINENLYNQDTQVARIYRRALDDLALLDERRERRMTTAASGGKLQARDLARGPITPGLSFINEETHAEPEPDHDPALTDAPTQADGSGTAHTPSDGPTSGDLHGGGQDLQTGRLRSSGGA